jgi:hypothetical protein
VPVSNWATARASSRNSAAASMRTRRSCWYLLPVGGSLGDYDGGANWLTIDGHSLPSVVAATNVDHLRAFLKVARIREIVRRKIIVCVLICVRDTEDQVSGLLRLRGSLYH